LGTFRLRRANLRLLIALAIIAILATSAYGFAASNTFAGGAGHAGDGSGTVSGYAVSSVAYEIKSNDPTQLSTVSFALDNIATTVKVSVDGGTNWADCSAALAPAVDGWTCDLSALNAKVVDITNLRVVAVQ